VHTRTFPALGFDPAPGSAADVESVLTRLADVSTVADGSADGLRRAARAGAWRGGAATAFRAGTHELAGGLTAAASALRDVARAVTAWQARLVANQREADELEARARSVRDDPDALARVLDRAGRLRARHLRQANAAAAAVRSGAADGWPVDSAALASGHVTIWTGDLALSLATPVWPPDTAPSGWPMGGPGPGLPGEEGGFGIPGAAGLGIPDLPGGPVPLPDLGLPSPGQAEVEVPGLPAATTPALDQAPPVRTPLDLPVRPLSDSTSPALASQHPHGLDRPAVTLPGRPAQVPEQAPASHRERTPVHDTAPRREVVRAEPTRQEPQTSGRGGAAHGPGRPGGLPAPGGPGHAPGRHPGPVDPAVPPAATGGGSVATPGAPPQPALHVSTQDVPHASPHDVPTGQTEEQAAQPAAPDQGRDAARPAIPERVADPGRAPENRTFDPGRGPLDGGRLTSTDAGRGLEQGRTTGADPGLRQQQPGTSQPHVPGKTRDADPDVAGVVGLPGDGARAAGPADGLRAFLLTRPGARPVLVLIKPGSDGEPIFRTGLTPCASPLPGCAAQLSGTRPSTVD
jgi:hypothetical protein